MTDVGKRIKAARESAGLTQEELAKKLGYKSKTTINKIESGINDLTPSKVEAFARALNTSPLDLMGWTSDSDLDLQLLASKSENNPGYYLNPETAEIAQEIHDNKDMRILFSAARDISPEDMKLLQGMALALKKKERGEE